MMKNAILLVVTLLALSVLFKDVMTSRPPISDFAVRQLYGASRNLGPLAGYR